MQPQPENVFPEDDETVLVSNEKTKQGPIRAYFDDEHKCFYSLEQGPSFPLYVTHWMRIPKFGF